MFTSFLLYSAAATACTDSIREMVEERNGLSPKCDTKKMNIIELYSCPNCGMGISGEKEKFIVCPECGSALCREKDFKDFHQKYCGKCGHELASVKENPKMVRTEEFYVCSDCGMTISGERKKYFVCPNCGRALCQEKDLCKLKYDYCIHCAHEIASAKKEAEEEIMSGAFVKDDMTDYVTVLPMNDEMFFRLLLKFLKY